MEAVLDPIGEKALDVWSDPRRRAQKIETGISRMARSLTALAAPNVSGLDPRAVALFADYSHWNGNIDLTKTAGYVDGIMTKASDGKRMYDGDPYDRENYKDKTLDANIQKAYDLGIPCIPYHYMHFVLEPGWTEQSIIDWQYDNIMHALKNKVPGKSYHAFALDIEVSNDSHTNAKSKVEKLTNRLTDTLGVPIIHYTRMGILNALPALRDWLSYQGADRNLWLAQYIFSGRVPVTWEKLYSDYISRVNMRVITPGFASWKWAQFAACFEVPGCTVNYTDLNFYNGTKEQAYAWLGYKQTTPPVEPPPVVDEPPAHKTPEERLAAIEQELTRLNGILANISAAARGD